MAPRGRPPKPTAVKELEGNPGKRALNKNEPKPTQKAPRCPSWLAPDAKKEWRARAKELEKMGLLSEADMATFASYCQSYARWKEAEEFISKHGSIFKTPSGYIQQVPQVSIAQQYQKQMRTSADALGFSPASRSRLSVESEQRFEGDVMAGLLSGVPAADDLMEGGT